MYSLETIKEMNNKAGNKAKNAGKKPMIYTGNTDELHNIPNIGSHEAKGFTFIRKFFVDSSGVGEFGELALTFNEFCEQVTKGRYYAIVSVGQFQVYINEYKKDD